jgi:predicted CXXCH cytochrome family protein
MISKRVAIVVTVIGIFGLMIIGICATQPDVASAEASKEMSPYELTIKPLTTAECAQCHLSVFQTIKTDGGKHQIDCVRCHTEYHAYNPRKQNYDAIMPKCASCHLSASGGPFHGEHKSLTPCLDCHGDPHKPLQIPMSGVETSCELCHSKEGNEIKNFPSKHTTDVACADCHAEKHGYIPECSACHESHSPAVQLTTSDCMTCHPVHRPTQITYAKDTPSAICAGCHADVNDMLQAKVTKHTAVLCSDCHPAHKEIPACSRCHGEPHSARMMVDVTKCGDCHGIAHDLAK